MANGKLEFNVSSQDANVGYLSLPDHPGSPAVGVVVKQLRLLDLCGKYEGPDIYLDFDKDNRLLGIEVLA
jgi:hypothetical protein